MADEQRAAQLSASQFLGRKDVLAGLLFMSVAILGLWISRDYPIGTALRMNTGYVPRLLCWLLLGLGAIIFFQGLRAPAEKAGPSGSAWRPVLAVTIGMVAFALSIERLGLIVAIGLLTAIAALAARGQRPLEVVLTAVVLAVLCWAVFIFGLGLVLPVWPDW
jgi:putative tricarboxylic transport membrane protein